MRPLLAHKAVVKLSLDLALNPVSTSAWVQITSALAYACVALEIFNPSPATMKISIGAAGQEDNNELPFYILPGGNAPSLIPIEISKGRRLSVKSIDNTANALALNMNFYG